MGFIEIKRFEYKMRAVMYDNERSRKCEENRKTHTDTVTQTRTHLLTRIQKKASDEKRRLFNSQYGRNNKCCRLRNSQKNNELF